MTQGQPEGTQMDTVEIAIFRAALAGDLSTAKQEFEKLKTAGEVRRLEAAALAVGTICFECLNA